MHPKRPVLPQPTSQELRDKLLDFLRRKFYNEPGDDKCFAQDRSRLLAWVVLWPAGYLKSRFGTTISADSYREIFFKILIDADAHKSDRLTYRPAWLRHVIQSHWKIHGEEYYQQAKNVRTLAEHTLLMVGKAAQPGPDPVNELAAACALLRPSKLALKRSRKEQLSLL
jgi:hypothetical protein